MCRLREAEFGERRLFQLAAVALACRCCLEYRASDLGFGQCPEHRRGVWFGGSPLLDCSLLHARQERHGLRGEMTEHLVVSGWSLVPPDKGRQTPAPRRVTRPTGGGREVSSPRSRQTRQS